MTTAGDLKTGAIVTGSLFPEPVEIIVATPVGASIRLVGSGVTTRRTYSPILSAVQIAQLSVSPVSPPFDGDARRFRLGVEAIRLGLAYEYDPYFSLSIARVDPLPHQLEAVYQYFLKLPRIRFLLADDPGAGKTIMAGLLLKELKARGLVRRTLIVAPANLTFQWQRELRDKFRESFEVIRGDVLRANYGQNPWQERDQVLTSVSWVSVIEDARESLLRSHWDLIIVDEAHKMAAYDESHQTMAYKLGMELSQRTDHFLLMTATPHKGDAKNFCLFLSLLDRDVYGDVKSLEEAMRRNSAPFYLRRTKEALITFPDPETGEVKKLFTNREVRTAAFDLDGDELEFYEDLTHYVEDQSIQAAADATARGRAVGFTMALLQRRMASSVYAVRRSLERMKDRREKILADPEAYRQAQIARRLPDDFDDLTAEEQEQIIEQIEGAVVSLDPAQLRDEISNLGRLIDQARRLESREVETKLTRLRGVLDELEITADPRNKLLIFTEHKDTLDFLVGDGKDGRPLGKLVEWGLAVTTIHGGMKIGSRDEPGTRIYAELEFRETAQVLVATEAAGEGINLQFCSRMVNYDIPWNPVRLEQRMGRIHRYGQERDCEIVNFVARNTREGRVLQKLLDRLLEIRRALGTDQVFDVVGEVFPANALERLFRDLYARKTDEQAIQDRIVRDVSPDRFRTITESTLEGLAKRELNLSAIVGRTAEARERRLVPEVVESFFVEAAPIAGFHPRETGRANHIYRIGRVPRTLWTIGEEQEPAFGRLGREYTRIAFDKTVLKDDPTLEWVTPGHPLFEAVRTDVAQRVAGDLRNGAVFFVLDREEPARLDVFTAAIKDGRGNTLHRRLFIVETTAAGQMVARQPTIFLELTPAPTATSVPDSPAMPHRDVVEAFLLERALEALREEMAAERERAIDTIAEHVELSLGVLLDRANFQLAELESRRIEGANVPGLEGQIAQASNHLEELDHRRDARRRELEMERHATIDEVTFVGSAWVLPHPERGTPQLRTMVRDPEIERIAVEVAMQHERDRGWDVESVESENRGFDLISRRPHAEDPKTFVEVRFIEVKGRAGVGEIALTLNEHRTAERLKGDYWLYTVFDCATNPRLVMVQDPARLGWQPVVQVEHYRVGPEQIVAQSEQRSGS
ncbi:MAG: SNF2-related protein [Chloroflexota bacterium]